MSDSSTVNSIIIKEGYLDVKAPPGTRDRKSWKAWKRRWVSAQRLTDDPSTIAVQLFGCQRTAVNGQLFSLSVSASSGVFYRSRSRTHPYAFSVGEGGRVVLHLAGINEAESQMWMAVLRDALWPPSPLVQLEAVLKDVHHVSVIDDKTICQAGLFAAYGQLYIAADKVTLVNLHSGQIIQEWPLLSISSAAIIRPDNGGQSGVFAFSLKGNPSREATKLCFYSPTAASVVASVSEAIRTGKCHDESPQNLAVSKYEDDLRELRDVFDNKQCVFSQQCQSIESNPKTGGTQDFLSDEPKTLSSNSPAKHEETKIIITKDNETVFDKMDERESENDFNVEENEFKVFVASDANNQEMPNDSQDSKCTIGGNSSPNAKIMSSCTQRSDFFITENGDKSFKCDLTAGLSRLANLSGDFLNCSINSFIIHSDYANDSGSTDSSDYTPPPSPHRSISPIRDEVFDLEEHERFCLPSSDMDIPGEQFEHFYESHYYEPDCPPDDDSEILSAERNLYLPCGVKRPSCLSVGSHIYDDIPSLPASKRPSLGAITLYEEVDDSDNDCESFNKLCHDGYRPPLLPPRNATPSCPERVEKRNNRSSTVNLQDLSNSITEALSQMQSPQVNSPQTNPKSTIGWRLPIKGVKKLFGKDKTTKSPLSSPSEECAKSQMVEPKGESQLPTVKRVLSEPQIIDLSKHEVDSSERATSLDSYECHKELAEFSLRQPLLVPFLPTTSALGKESSHSRAFDEFRQRNESDHDHPPKTGISHLKKESGNSFDSLMAELDCLEPKHSCLHHFLQSLGSDKHTNVPCSCACSNIRSESRRTISVESDRMLPSAFDFNARRHSKSLSLDIEKHLKLVSSRAKGQPINEELPDESMKELPEAEDEEEIYCSSTLKENQTIPETKDTYYTKRHSSDYCTMNPLRSAELQIGGNEPSLYYDTNEEDKLASLNSIWSSSVIKQQIAGESLYVDMSRAAK